MDEHDLLAERFETHRARLRAIAYQTLGSASDADDAAQEAWLRLSRTDPGNIDNFGGWLTTIVARVCLNMLQSRREEPVADAARDRARPSRSWGSTSRTSTCPTGSTRPAAGPRPRPAPRSADPAEIGGPVGFPGLSLVSRECLFPAGCRYCDVGPLVADYDVLTFVGFLGVEQTHTVGKASCHWRQGQLAVPAARPVN